eukprot:CAMPEP_0203755232 /NCGR_PEP_ID=MMETSP0098-20131031/8712_1 /ASSEMBLY_ACC=CAM_ASM_000208 /TAXON_ID=96639 /ORGANISM=" , Strain NY0313808BC1" /LENGTH=349 /DNA_ID=CAMNT_0050646597 /DNA_START=93 /DNA_END=1139 /DNA_ORIENTATION=+
MLSAIDQDWIRVHNKRTGCLYYWNTKTDKTTWDIPNREDALSGVKEQTIETGGNVTKIVWEKVKDNDGNIYFWNVHTDETLWALPEGNDQKKEQAAPSMPTKTATPIETHTQGTEHTHDASPRVSRGLKIFSRLSHPKRKGSEHAGKKPSAKNSQFGTDLIHCARVQVNGYTETIPIVLVILKEAFIKLEGPITEGIFRVPPNGDECLAVKQKIDKVLGPEALEGCVGPTTPAALLKQFFRDLPSGVLNSLDKERIAFYCDKNTNLDMQALVGELPQPHRDVLLWLVDFLVVVASNHETNRMDAKNLGIVFGPNMYSSEDPARMDDVARLEFLSLLPKLNKIVENLILW